MTTIRFSGNQSAFYTELKARVNQYFESRNSTHHGDQRSLLKSSILLGLFFGSYILLTFRHLPDLPAIALCAVLGFITSAIGFNIMHDGAHGSLSRNKWINKLAALTLNMFGGSSALWNIKHNIIHHSFTNVDGHDDDILNEPLFRMTRFQRRRRIHRLQYLYWPLAYGLMYIGWIMFLDFSKYFRGRIAERKNIRFSFSQHLGFWLTKVFYIAFYVLLPLRFYSWEAWLLGFSIFAFSTGLTISIVFQLAHTVEETECVKADEKTDILPTDWATHQVRTTANFATGSRIITWFTGGLNFQVEHHLFPRVSHVHYPAISHIVRETCSKYGLPYYEAPTLSNAIASHVRFLYQLGRN
ncbi:MAG: acyl-CoA desaturase [Bacteroidia bacterium]|nr:acyl-CoA desaturase [Bacteroidia bacterium]